MGRATEINGSLCQVLGQVDVEQIHPADRLNMCLTTLRLMFPHDRLYECVLDQGAEEDEEYEGPPSELL